jgi:hypothetical protein
VKGLPTYPPSCRRQFQNTDQMRRSKNWALFVLLLPLHSDAFLVSLLPSNHRCSLRSLYHAVDMDAVSVKLTWEVIAERMSRPVLDLSSNRDELRNNQSLPTADTSAWDQGQRWSETKEGLHALDLSPADPFLNKCPQLYRLESTQILETARWIIQKEGFGLPYVMKEPRVLSYKCYDVDYGLEFLKQMTMSNSLTLLVPLLISGIEGGLQERAVQEALGAAADATYNANQRIAGDAAATLKALKRKAQS